MTKFTVGAVFEIIKVEYDRETSEQLFLDKAHLLEIKINSLLLY